MLRLKIDTMEKYKNKYRISSARLPHWDYGANALYFVTICTKHRKCFFGIVDNGQIQLSGIGALAEKYWLEIPHHFPFVVLHHHIIMPNHVHGIIEIAKPNDGGNDGRNVETQNFASLQQPTPITTPLQSPLSTDRDNPKNQFGPQSKNLASIIRGFKIGVTKNARQINADFAWQSRYHDHIIRNDESYHRISNYIISNPANWQEDKFFK